MKMLVKILPLKDGVSRSEALEIFADDPYKVELINDFHRRWSIITVYTQGDFFDWPCRGGQCSFNF